MAVSVAQAGWRWAFVRSLPSGPRKLELHVGQMLHGNKKAEWPASGPLEERCTQEER